MVQQIKHPKGFATNICDWIWSGTREVNVFVCPACFGEVITLTVVPKYCTHCGLKFSNGGLEMEE